MTPVARCWGVRAAFLPSTRLRLSRMGTFLDRVAVSPAEGRLMSKNLYVGNLSFTATEAELSETFGQHGTVTRASIVMDRESGRSRGFGFVEMSDGGEAAIQALNGAMLGGRALTVNEAKPREER